MAFLSSLLQFTGTMLLVLLVFNFIILVHELGHFLAARWRGLKVEKFQIWMGKPLWKRMWGDVQWGLGWLPLGGFVSLPQMAPMEALEGRSPDGSSRRNLPPVKPIDKIIVAAAGPLFSVLLAVAFACVVWVVGKPEFEEERTTTVGHVVAGAPADGKLLPGDRILRIDGREVTRFLGIHDSVQWAVASSGSNPIPFVVERPGHEGPLEVLIDAPLEASEEYRRWSEKSWLAQLFSRPPLRKVGIGPVGEVIVNDLYPDGPAEEAGMRRGDRIVSVEGQTVYSIGAFYDMVEKAEGRELAVEVIRDGGSLTLKLKPRPPLEGPEEALKSVHPGVRSWGYENHTLNRVIVHPNPLTLSWHAFANTFSTLGALVSPNSAVSPGHLSGPVGIMNLYYQIFQSPDGWRLVLYFSIILNISLAILNMLPLPVLDGGHIMMSVYEIVRGRSPSLRVLEAVQMACVVLLLSFVLFVTLKDIGGLRSGPVKEIRFAPARSA